MDLVRRSEGSASAPAAPDFQLKYGGSGRSTAWTRGTAYIALSYALMTNVSLHLGDAQAAFGLPVLGLIFSHAMAGRVYLSG